MFVENGNGNKRAPHFFNTIGLLGVFLLQCLHENYYFLFLSIELFFNKYYFLFSFQVSSTNTKTL